MHKSLTELNTESNIFIHDLFHASAQKHRSGISHQATDNTAHCKSNDTIPQQHGLANDNRERSN